MTKVSMYAEKMAVTFGEAAIAYFLVAPNPQLNRTAIIGVIGSGLSAVYNMLRESSPPSMNPPATAAPSVTYAPTPPITP